MHRPSIKNFTSKKVHLSLQKNNLASTQNNPAAPKKFNGKKNTLSAFIIQQEKEGDRTHSWPSSSGRNTESSSTKKRRAEYSFSKGFLSTDCEPASTLLFDHCVNVLDDNLETDSCGVEPSSYPFSFQSYLDTSRHTPTDGITMTDPE